MKKTLLWIGALILGALLGLLGIAWLDELMNFVATIYTRLFQLLAVPTIVLAVITTFATFGSQGSGRIFGRIITYTLLPWKLCSTCSLYHATCWQRLSAIAWRR